MANETIQTRVSDHLKKEAEALFANMGLGLSDAIRMFLQQSVNEGGIPFQPRARSTPGMALPTLKAFDDYLAQCEAQITQGRAKPLSISALLKQAKRIKD